MSNVLDLVDQTIFRVERAAGVTNLIQCVWVYNRAVDIDGLRRFHHHLQQGPAVPPHRTLTVAVRPPSLGLAQRPARARDRRDASAARRIRRLARRAGQHPTGCRARTRMAPCGAAVHRRRRRGELGRLTLPHRRRRALRGRWRTRLAATTTQSAGPLAESRRRWQALREDARQTVRDIPAIGRAVAAAARFVRRNRGTGLVSHAAYRAPPAGADELITLPTATIFVDADEWDARAHSLGGTSNTLLAALAARLAQRVGRRRRRRLGHLDDAHQRAHRRRYPRQRHHECRHHGRPRTRDDGPARDPGRNQASADPLQGGSPTNGGHCCPLFLWCLSGSASDGSARPPTVRPAWARPTSVRSTRPSTGQTAQTPTTSSMKSLSSGYDHGDDAPARRPAVVALGKSAWTGLRLGRCISAGPTNSDDELAAACFERSERLLADRHTAAGEPARVATRRAHGCLRLHSRFACHNRAFDEGLTATATLSTMRKTA